MKTRAADVRHSRAAGSRTLLARPHLVTAPQALNVLNVTALVTTTTPNTLYPTPATRSEYRPAHPSQGLLPARLLVIAIRRPRSMHHPAHLPIPLPKALL